MCMSDFGQLSCAGKCKLWNYAPSKRTYVVERPMNDWMTYDILILKALRRKYESLWRKTRLTVHFDIQKVVWM